MTGWDDEDAEPYDPWAPWEQGDQGPPEVPVFEVYVAEHAEPIGYLLDPRGEVAVEVYPAVEDRPPFGFHP